MKNIKKIIFSVSIILCLSLLSENVQAAKKVKMNPTKKTIYVGKTATVKLSNNKSKVKWSVSNSKIRIVKKSNKSAKIKAVKKGTSYLKAKVGNKTYKCKFSIKTQNSKSKETVKFSKKDADKKINKSEFTVNGKICVKVVSNYECPTDISAKCTFYDSYGNPVDYKNDSLGFIEKGHTGFLIFTIPEADYSRYEIKYDYSEGLKYFYHDSVIDSLSLTTNFVKGEYYDYIMLEVSNSGKKDCYYCQIAIVYYDSNGNILDVDIDSVSEINPGGSETSKSYISSKALNFSRYDAFITYAYHLGK